MKTGAYELLEGAIDYAGLYPPAKLPLSEAVREYLEILSGEGDWLTTRFVCPAADREDVSRAFQAEIEEFEGDPLPLSLVSAGEDMDRDTELLLAEDIVAASAYELKLTADSIASARGRLKTLMKKVEPVGMAVFVELPWGPDMADQMHQVAEISENVGFKARTGGLTADAFPSAADLAGFIVEAASLEAPFKFTAGLHEPLRHLDEELQVMRHGFINVLVASALATCQDLSVLEVQRILEITDATRFVPSDQGLEVDDWSLNRDEIADFRDSFGGFGSCSVMEPLEGLHRIGWLA